MTEVDLRVYDVMEMEQLVKNINSIAKEVDQLTASINNLSRRAGKLIQCLYDILFPHDDSKIFFYYYPTITVPIVSPFCNHNAYVRIHNSNYSSPVVFECSCSTTECADVYSSLDEYVVILCAFIASLPKLKEFLQSMLQDIEMKREDKKKRYETMLSLMDRVEKELKPITLARDLAK